MENFVNTVKSLYKNESKTFMVSIITTKDYKTDLKLLLENFEDCDFVFTNGTIKDKFWNSKTLYNFAKSLNTSNHLKLLELDDGIKLLNSEVNFVVGSFYVYDKVKKLLK